MTIIIKNWNENFEIAESRRYKKNKWFPLPNKMDDLQYIKISRHPKRHEIFACWILLLQIASKMPKRGVLEDSRGPLGLEDLELLTGFPAQSFGDTIEYLSQPKIDWIEVLNPEGTLSAPVANSEVSLGVPKQSSQIVPATEHNITEHNKRKESVKKRKSKPKTKIIKTEPSVKKFLTSIAVEFPKLANKDFFDLFVGHCLEKEVNTSERAIRMRLKSLDPYPMDWCKARIAKATNYGWKGLVFDDDSPENSDKSPNNSNLQARITKAQNIWLDISAKPENFTQDYYERIKSFLQKNNCVPAGAEVDAGALKKVEVDA